MNLARKSIYLPILLLITLFSSPVSSLDSPCGIDDSECEEAVRVLTPIVVTATRRESPLQRVPLSVTALSGERLAAMGATGFEDFARSVPGLSFNDAGFGGEQYVIRGISTGIYGDARAATAVYLDDMPITQAGGGSLSFSPDPLLVDIARIEVLRGPQGSLFGSGSMGGAIRIITNEPNPLATEAFAEAGLSHTEHGGLGYDLRGMMNLPLGDGGAALRAVAYQRETSGWIDNILLGRSDVNNVDISGFRLAGKWSNQSRLSIKVSLAHQERSSDGSALDEGQPPWTQQRHIDEPVSDEWSLINLEIGYEFDWGRFVSTTSGMDRTVQHLVDTTDLYRWLLTGVFPPELLPTVETHERRDQQDFVQEFRLSSNGDAPLDWLIGLYYQDQEWDVEQRALVPGLDEMTGGLGSMFGAADHLVFGRGSRPLEQLAAYGDVNWKLSDHWAATIGGRWFRFEHAYRSSSFGIIVPPGAGQTETDETGFTPRLGLSWFPSPDVMLYSTVAAGYRPGGANETVAENYPGCTEELAYWGLNGIPPSYESDSLWSYEVGLKSRWPDKQLSLNAAAFHIDWSDMQTSAVLACGASWRENAGSVSSQGVEFELLAYPGEQFEFRLNGAWTDARLSEDVPGLGGTDGDRIPGVPEYAIGGSAAWFFDAFDGAAGSVRVDYQYVGNSWSAFQLARREIPSHSLTHLRFGLSKGQWAADLFFNNLFGERAVVSFYENLLGKYVTTAAPFTVGVNLRFNY